MTVRPGQYGSRLVASSILGSVNGLVVNLANSAWGVFVSGAIVFTATATVGNRSLVFGIEDPANFFLWRTFGSVITAGQNVRISIGAGLTNQSFAGPPLGQVWGVPVEMPIPPLAQVVIFDFNGIDVNDTVNQANFIFAM